MEYLKFLVPLNLCISSLVYLRLQKIDDKINQLQYKINTLNKLNKHQMIK